MISFFLMLPFQLTAAASAVKLAWRAGHRGPARGGSGVVAFRGGPVTRLTMACHHISSGIALRPRAASQMLLAAVRLFGLPRRRAKRLARQGA